MSFAHEYRDSRQKDPPSADEIRNAAGAPE
jgi:hypothetical protein